MMSRMGLCSEVGVEEPSSQSGMLLSSRLRVREAGASEIHILALSVLAVWPARASPNIRWLHLSRGDSKGSSLQSPP